MTKGLTFDDVLALGSELPEVVEAKSYGTRSLKVRGKMIARIWEDDVTLVLRLPFVVRDHLLSAAPTKYHLTDHYRDYPYILVRLPKVSARDLRPLLEEAWREVAPKRLVTSRDETVTRRPPKR